MQKKTLLYPNIHAELARSGLTVAMLADYMGMTAQNLYGKLKGATAVTEKRSEEHTSELQSRENLVCRLLLEKKKKKKKTNDKKKKKKKMQRRNDTPV